MILKNDGSKFSIFEDDVELYPTHVQVVHSRHLDKAESINS